MNRRPRINRTDDRGGPDTIGYNLPRFHHDGLTEIRFMPSRANSDSLGPEKKKGDSRHPEDDSAPIDSPRIERAVREILLAIGEDPDREGLVKTPGRVARAYGELMAGLRQDPRRHLKTVFHERYDEVVLLRDIEFHSLCEHHLLPFMGRAHVAYLPDGKVVGLSKLARLVEGYARRPQVQERLTTQIADALMAELQPIGAACVIEAVHTCMTIRGAKKHGSTMVTSALRGIFKENPASRAEILSLMYAKNGGRS
jgi:GTP cyclohydrolase I